MAHAHDDGTDAPPQPAPESEPHAAANPPGPALLPSKQPAGGPQASPPPPRKAQRQRLLMARMQQPRRTHHQRQPQPLQPRHQKHKQQQQQQQEAEVEPADVPTLLRQGSEPLIMSSRSQLGPQVESVKRSAPRATFGSAQRWGSSERMFISKEHSRCVAPSWTPGPNAYNVMTDKAPPLPRIKAVTGPLGGTEKRFALDSYADVRSAHTPGPGTYDTGSPERTRMLSQHVGSHGPSIGHAERKRVPEKGFELEFYGQVSPGPVYTPQEPSGGHGNAAGPGHFPRAPRTGLDPAAKSYAEKLATTIPGPGAYVAGPALDNVRTRSSVATFGKGKRDIGAVGAPGKDSPGYLYHVSASTVLSKHHGTPTAAFPRSHRLTKLEEETPGPGAYVV